VVHLVRRKSTVTLDTPTTPKITRVLRLLLNELNTHPPLIPATLGPSPAPSNTT